MQQKDKKSAFLQLARTSKSLKELEVKVQRKGIGDSIVAEHPKLTREINVRTVLRAASEVRDINNGHFEKEYGFLGNELMAHIRRLACDCDKLEGCEKCSS